MFIFLVFARNLFTTNVVSVSISKQIRFFSRYLGTKKNEFV